ncbi:MAG: hypothetical protein QOI53_4523 [Verrucomicrobiota bacterium]|nr:hypothetical protein [Verrucomicrobiota bacterium]
MPTDEKPIGIMADTMDPALRRISVDKLASPRLTRILFRA